MLQRLLVWNRDHPDIYSSFARRLNVALPDSRVVIRAAAKHFPVQVGIIHGSPDAVTEHLFDDSVPARRVGNHVGLQAVVYALVASLGQSDDALMSLLE